MLRSIGVSEADLGDGQTGIIMSDLVVNFRAEGFMFDELLIDTHIGEFSRTGFRIFHRVTKGKTLIALAETGITTFDYTSRKIAPVPETLHRALAKSGTP
jgi:acyl-CoA thioesterase FadM